MNAYSWLQLILYIVVLLLLAWPLGIYMARVYQGERTFLDWLFRPIERFIYRLAGVHTDETNWKTYALAMMLFNDLGLLVVYILQRVQGWLPPQPAEGWVQSRRTLPGTPPSASPPTPTGRATAGSDDELPDPDGGA